MMNRKRKVVVYLVLIIFLIGSFLFFSGYHFSREACIEDTLRGMDGIERHEVMTISVKGGRDVTLFMDENGENAIHIGTKKVVFLYKTVSIGQVNSEGNGETPIKELALVRGDNVRVFFIRRIDKSIEKARITIGESEPTVQELTWKDDITGFLIEVEKEEQGTFINIEFLDANDNQVFFTFLT